MILPIKNIMINTEFNSSFIESNFIPGACFLCVILHKGDPVSRLSIAGSSVNIIIFIFIALNHFYILLTYFH